MLDPSLLCFCMLIGYHKIQIIFDRRVGTPGGGGTMLPSQTCNPKTVYSGGS